MASGEWGDFCNGVERNSITPPRKGTLMFQIWRKIICALSEGKTSFNYHEAMFGFWLPYSNVKPLVNSEATNVLKWLGVEYD